MQSGYNSHTQKPAPTAQAWGYVLVLHSSTSNTIDAEKPQTQADNGQLPQ